MKKKEIFYTQKQVEAFLVHAREIIDHPRFLTLKQFTQHGSTTTYEHVITVAFYSYLFATKHYPSCDARSLIRGALLHDYFLYDWHHRGNRPRLHGLRHPRIALKNAVQDFSLNALEKEIIRCHMFPLTFVPPRHKESMIVSYFDKVCSCREMRRSSFNTLLPHPIFKTM